MAPPMKVISVNLGRQVVPSSLRVEGKDTAAYVPARLCPFSEGKDSGCEIYFAPPIVSSGQVPVFDAHPSFLSRSSKN
jgi:hypothetical protein